MSNALLILEIYRHAKTWCFTDSQRGLLHEPFVLGVPEIIDYVIEQKEKLDYSKTYQVIFSDTQFPGASYYLQQLRSEFKGCWYTLFSVTDEQQDVDEGWLCPATLKFFDQFPVKIYVSIKSLEPAVDNLV
jgi:hypothetical protein